MSLSETRALKLWEFETLAQDMKKAHRTGCKRCGIEPKQKAR